MISLEEAVAQILAAIEPLPPQSLPPGDSLGRYLASDVFSPVHLPPFDNSAMDGYAVRSLDLKQATLSSEISLRRVGTVGAGERFPGELRGGECIRIFTGSPLPAGADAVVMQEDVRAGGDEVFFHEAVAPFENVRLGGEDLKEGAPIARAGQKITPTLRALFAACGLSEIQTGARARVALLATGSELADAGQPLKPGQIYESNRMLLDGLLKGIGAEPVWMRVAVDDLEGTKISLREAFAAADTVITTGGVSVGEFDFVKAAFAGLGGNVDLWKVAVRPGKPFVFGRLEKKVLFGLPGNPVSALVTFLLLARPGILKQQGARDLQLKKMPGILQDDLVNNSDRRHFTRVRLDSGLVSQAGPQASHMLAGMADANGLVDVPPGGRLPRGSQVQVLVWDCE